jgi:hypothetical protein
MNSLIKSLVKTFSMPVSPVRFANIGIWTLVTPEGSGPSPENLYAHEKQVNRMTIVMGIISLWWFTVPPSGTMVVLI